MNNISVALFHYSLVEKWSEIWRNEILFCVLRAKLNLFDKRK